MAYKKELKRLMDTVAEYNKDNTVSVALIEKIMETWDSPNSEKYIDSAFVLNTKTTNKRIIGIPNKVNKVRYINENIKEDEKVVLFASDYLEKGVRYLLCKQITDDFSFPDILSNFLHFMKITRKGYRAFYRKETKGIENPKDAEIAMKYAEQIDIKAILLFYFTKQDKTKSVATKKINENLKNLFKKPVPVERRIIFYLQENFQEDWDEFVYKVEEEIREEQGIDENAEVPCEMYMQYVEEEIGGELSYLERFNEWYEEEYDVDSLLSLMEIVREDLKLNDEDEETEKVSPANIIEYIKEEYDREWNEYVNEYGEPHAPNKFALDIFLEFYEDNYGRLETRTLLRNAKYNLLQDR